MCCSVLYCVLQCVCFSPLSVFCCVHAVLLQCVASCCSMSQYVVVCCSVCCRVCCRVCFSRVQQSAAGCCSVLQCVAVCCRESRTSSSIAGPPYSPSLTSCPTASISAMLQHPHSVLQCLIRGPLLEGTAPSRPPTPRPTP